MVGNHSHSFGIHSFFYYFLVLIDGTNNFGDFSKPYCNARFEIWMLFSCFHIIIFFIFIFVLYFSFCLLTFTGFIVVFKVHLNVLSYDLFSTLFFFVFIFNAFYFSHNFFYSSSHDLDLRGIYFLTKKKLIFKYKINSLLFFKMEYCLIGRFLGFISTHF